MTSFLQHRVRLLLFVAALLVPLVVAEAPAEAQRSGASARRSRRARVRARRAEARRRQVRNQRRRARRAAARERVAQRRARARSRRSGAGELAVSVQDEAVDMDFAAEMPALDEAEAPPPMERYHVEEATRAQADSALDPELYGAPGGSSGPSGPRHRSTASPLTVRAALRGISRGISYSGRERGTLNDYALPFGAALTMGADYYPAAHLTEDALAGLGMTWDAEHSLGVSSLGPNSIAYPTRSYAWNIGVRYRGVLDAAGSELAAEVGAGQRGFFIDRGSLEHPAPEGVPDVEYTQLRLGGAGRFVIDDVALGFRAAYLPVFDLGDLGNVLGGGSAHGGEVAVSFSYALGLGFSVLAEVDARVYGLSFAPPAESEVAASGAIDHHIGVNLGVEWRMPADASL